jgi:hypothetical protein
MENHQFNLFSFQEIRPKKKIKISKEQIAQANELCKKGRSKDAACVLSDLNDRLEDFLEKMG